jgi:hypothetical protein
MSCQMKEQGHRSEQVRFWLIDRSVWHDINRRRQKPSAVFLISICIQRNSTLMNDLFVVSLPVFKCLETFVKDDMRRSMTRYSLESHRLTLESA